MWAPVLVFSSRMISYPCFPPLSSRDSTKRSRKLFTIRSLTALVIFSRELSRFDIIEFQYNPPLKRVSHPGQSPDPVEPRDGLPGARVHTMPHHLFTRRGSPKMPEVQWAIGYNNQSRDSQRDLEAQSRPHSVYVEVQGISASR